MIHHTFNPRVLKNLIKQLDPYVNETVVSIPEWDSYTGVHTEPAVIELDDAPVHKMKLGDRWSAQRDILKTNSLYPSALPTERFILPLISAVKQLSV